MDVMEYIANSKHQKSFKSFLENQGIIFRWSPGDEIAHIECHGQEIESAVKALKLYLQDFKTREIPVKEVFWRCVVAGMPTIGAALGNNPPLVKSLGNEMKLKIVSFKSNIDYDKKRLKAELKKLEKEASYDCKTYTNCSKEYICLLQKINFQSNHLGQNCKDVEVTFDDENGEIRLKGPKYQLNVAMERFQEQEIATSEKQLKLPQTILKFLMTNEGQQEIERTLQQYQIEAIVVFDDPCPSKPLSAKVLGYANDAIARIRDIATEKEIKIEESNVCLTRSLEWIRLCDEMKIENGVLIRVSDAGSTWITGTEENVRKAAEKLQEFLDVNSIEEEEYVCRSSDIMEYIIHYCREELDFIEAELAEFDVQFIGHDEDCTIYLSGRKKGLEKSKLRLDSLERSFVFRRLERRQPGLRKYFEKDGIGHGKVELIQRDQKCFIKVEKNFEKRSDRDCFVTAHGHTISWKIGDIAKEQVNQIQSGYLCKCFLFIYLFICFCLPISFSWVFIYLFICLFFIFYFFVRF